MRQTSQSANTRAQKGRIGEQKASQWLESQGFSILARNYFTQWGEIDIIALKNACLHFVEVKNFSARTLSPRYAITPKKRARIAASIQALCLELSSSWDMTIASMESLDSWDFSTHDMACYPTLPQTKTAKQAAIIYALHKKNLHIESCAICIDALLLWGGNIGSENIELLENITMEIV